MFIQIKTDFKSGDCHLKEILKNQKMLFQEETDARWKIWALRWNEDRKTRNVWKYLNKCCLYKIIIMSVEFKKHKHIIYEAVTGVSVI